MTACDQTHDSVSGSAAQASSSRRVDRINRVGGTAVASISRQVEDSCWDKFLQETPLGQFQQSTIWARAKASEGWRVVRLVLTVDEEIVGGFQILWRPSWRGRVAYDRSKALTILNGKSFTPEQVKSRYMFLARMGGSPRLLPETRVYFANP